MAQQLILDRYRPMGNAWTGGFSTVQVAWDTRIRRKVAIKCLDLSEAPCIDASGSEPEWLASIPGLEEARTAALLSDLNIVTVYDFEIQDATAYLIMEYVDGLTLEQLLCTYGDSITLNTVAAVLFDVGHALARAHENGVLHLDVKPANILIDRQGRAKVTDFGLATLADASGRATTGSGTIGYMPLEQMQQELLDARTDEWALASVIYEMLSGKNPFLAPTLERAEELIADAELVVPSQCWDALASEADDVVFYALDPDPDERYETVAEFVEEHLPYLGSIKQGYRELAAIVNGVSLVSHETDGEESAQIAQPERAKVHQLLSERITPRVKAGAYRLLCAGGAAIIAASAASGVAEVSTLPTYVIPALIGGVALLAGIAPNLGVLVVLLCFAGACLVARLLLLGCVLAAATVVWWLSCGRCSRAAAGVLLAFPVLGAFGIPMVAGGISGFAPIGALVSGCMLRLRAAVASSAIGCVLMFALASLAGGDVCGFDAVSLWAKGLCADLSVTVDAVANPELAILGEDVSEVQQRAIELLIQPATWAAFAAWCVACAVVSAAFSRQSRLFASIGACVGASVLVTVEYTLLIVCAYVFPTNELDYTVLIAPTLSAVGGAAVICVLVRICGLPARR